MDANEMLRMILQRATERKIEGGCVIRLSAEEWRAAIAVLQTPLALGGQHMVNCHPAPHAAKAPLITGQVWPPVQPAKV